MKNSKENYLKIHKILRITPKIFNLLISVQIKIIFHMILTVNFFKNKKDNPLKDELETILIKKKLLYKNIPGRIP